MPLIFLHVPADGGKRGRAGPLPWYDALAALISFAGCIYILLRFPALSELVNARPWDGLIVAGGMIVLILEGLRRTTGTGLLYTTVFFFVLALVAGHLPGEFAAKSIPFDRLTYYSVWDSTAVLGVTLKIVATVVVVFVLFGNVLLKSGGAGFFTDVSIALMGRYRGGPAKIAILGSSLFGTVSGNVVSNIITVGVVTIPLMIRVGFRPHLAAAIEANASTGGQIMPPVMGIAAFVMAEFLRVPYAEVALAAAIPAILFYIALFIQVDLEAARSHIRPMEPEQIPRLKAVLKAGWHFPIPFVALIYALFWGGEEAEGAGLIAIAVALVLALVFPFQGKRIGIRDLYEMLRDTGTSVIDLFMIGAAAGIMIGALNYSGAGFTLSLVLIHLAGGSLIGLLVLAAVANIILGAGLPTVGCYILLATLGGAEPDPDGDRADGGAHVHSLLRLPVGDLPARRGRGLRRRQSRRRRPQQDRLDGDGVRLDHIRHPVPVRVFRNAVAEGRPRPHRHRRRHRDRGSVADLGGGDGLFRSSARYRRSPRLRCDRHWPAASGRRLRRRALAQPRRRRGRHPAVAAGANASARAGGGRRAARILRTYDRNADRPTWRARPHGHSWQRRCGMTAAAG